VRGKPTKIHASSGLGGGGEPAGVLRNNRSDVFQISWEGCLFHRREERKKSAT